MDAFELADILEELYPMPPGYDPMEECRRIKEEVAREYWSLSRAEQEKYFDDVDDNDFDRIEVDINNITREELIAVLKENDRRRAAKKGGMIPYTEYRHDESSVLEVAETAPEYGGKL